MLFGLTSRVASCQSKPELPGSRWARQARSCYARLRPLTVKAAAVPADLNDPKWAEVASAHDSRCSAYRSLLPAMAAHGCRVGALEPAGLIFLPERTREACLGRMVEWFTLGDTNEEMVDRLKEYGWVQSEAVEQAMKAVDRRLYTLDPERGYLDFSIPGLSWDTVHTAPYMQAFGFWLLRDGLVPGAKVLDIGSGSGYATAVMAHMVTRGGADGKAIGIELFDELTQQAKERAASIPALAELLDNGSLQYATGDGREGLLSEAPFDVIYCGAAAKDIPEDILVQLKEGG